MSGLNKTFPVAEVPSNVSGKHLHQGQEIMKIREQSASFGATDLSQDNEMMNPCLGSSSSCFKRRKLKSKVWDDFTKNKGEDGKEWATCNYCKKKFVGSSKSGTTHLKNHLERCPSKRNPGKGGADNSAVQTSDFLTSGQVIQGTSTVDRESNHLDVTRWVIKYYGSSLKFMRDDLLRIFKEEKGKLRKYINQLPCRLNISVEWFGTDYLSFPYSVVLSFINDSWELKKRVISLQFKGDMKEFFEIQKCLVLDWNIDKDICSAQLDDHDVQDDHENKLESDKEYVKFTDWLTGRSSLPFAGKFFSVGWLVDQLRKYWWVKDYVMVFKIPKLKDHVRRMSSHGNNNFQIAIDKANSMGKKMTSQGVPTTAHWDFELLEWAVGFKEAFYQLEQIDPDFKSVNLTKAGWDKATAIYKCWKVLKDAASSLSDCICTSANVYFPKICGLYMTLLQWGKSDKCYVREIASDVREKFFDKYWNNSVLILVINIILDPRFKIDIVEHWYKEIYNSEANTHLKKILLNFTNIHNEYAKRNSSTRNQIVDAMGRPCTPLHYVDDITLARLELDCYLRDSKPPAIEEFDVLIWWRLNSLRFPTLARMARDFLSIPVSTPASVLDSSLQAEIRDIFFQHGLDSDIKEALVYTKIWLYSEEK